MEEPEMTDAIHWEGMELRLQKFWRMFLYITAGPMLALFGWALSRVLIDNPTNWLAISIVVPACLGMITLIIYGVLEARFGRYVITASSVSYFTWYSERTLLHSDIAGYRLSDNQIKIVSSDKARSITISHYTEDYRNLEEFICQMHIDLDAENLRRAKKGIITDPRYGNTKDERRNRLALAGKVATVINVIGSAIGGWTLFYPKPYALALWASIGFVMVPLIAMVFFRGLIRINDEKGLPQPYIAFGLMFPALAILIRSLFDYNIVDPMPLIRYSSAIGISLTVMYCLFTKEFTYRKFVDYFVVLVVFFVLWGAGYGTSTFINKIFDNSIPKQYSVKVVNKTETSGKNATHTLHITPWGDHKDNGEIDVGGVEYSSTEVGDEVLIIVREGALGAAWLEYEL